MLRTLDLRPKGCEFDSQLGQCQAVTHYSTWMSNCRRTNKPLRYITNHQDNSAFHASGIDKSNYKPTRTRMDATSGTPLVLSNTFLLPSCANNT